MSDVKKPIKFKTTKEKNVFNLPWPQHIPDCCPHCDASMSRRVNLFHTKSRYAERLRYIAPWLSLVILLTILILMAFITTGPMAGGQGTPMAIIAMILIPPTVLTIISNCIPKVFKLQCHRCEFQKDFRYIPEKETTMM